MTLRMSGFSMIVATLCVIFTYLYLNNGIEFKNVSFNKLIIPTLYVKMNKSLMVDIKNATIKDTNITFDTTFRYSIGDSFSTLHILKFNSNVLHSKIDISLAVDIGDLFNYQKGVFRGHIHIIDILLKFKKNSKYALIQKKNTTIYYNAKFKNNTIEIFTKNPKLHYVFKNNKHFLTGQDDANLILSYLAFAKPIGNNSYANAQIKVEMADKNDPHIDYANFKIYAKAYNLSLDIDSSVFASNTTSKEFPYGVFIQLHNATMVYDGIPARYDNATLFMNKYVFKVDGTHKRTKASLALTKSGGKTFFYLNAKDGYDEDVNLIYNKTLFEGGKFDITMGGFVGETLKAKVNAYDTKMLNNKQLNSINAMSRTLTLATYGAITIFTAGLAAPLLVQDVDLTVGGYPIQKAHLYVEHPSDGGRMFIKNMHIQSKGSNVAGFLDYNLTKSTIKGKLRITYLKTLGKTLSSIPIVKQLTTGSDNEFSTTIYIKGDSQNPTITTKIVKNTLKQTAKSSFDIIKIPFEFAQKLSHKKQETDTLNNWDDI